ncbi:MAG TPA: TetR/AcrR family transcriptional regulator [Candidatus Desulfobacillus sp.]|nr:TetR/AcrR family transcriptional regulator [Candidatus Desulfobacillus sp.]
MERKPKRRTRERILEAGLRLFNEIGEPNVTTTAIADELDISPGNLYYHFRSKNDIVNALFAAFEREIGEILAAPARRRADVEDIWLFLHLLFETVWKYRFLYRDLDDLLSRNRLLETRFKQILAHKERTAAQLCHGLVASGQMRADAAEIQALATNVACLATYWLPFEYARDPRRRDAGDALGRGVYQLMSLLAPFLQGDARHLLQRLSQEYL